MALARLKHEGNRLTSAVRPARSAWWRSRLVSDQGLRFLGPLFCTGSVLVGTNDGAIDEMDAPIKVACTIGLGLERRKDVVPDAFLAPAIVTTRDRADGTIALRQRWPGCAGAQDPQDAVDNPTMIFIWPTSMRFLRWEQRLEARPLFVCEIMSVHTAQSQQGLRQSLQIRPREVSYPDW
jgi:hypothetical protein